MIQDRIIVCIANRWDYDPTSKHQVMKILGRYNDIVWVNYRGTRRPQATATDARAIVSTLRNVMGGVKPIHDRMVQLTPLVIPGARGAACQALNRWLVAKQIRRAVHMVQRGRNLPVQLWTFAPDVAYLADALPREHLVYYCVDEYTEFEDFDRETVAAAERRLMECADVVITTSSTLYQTKRQWHANTHLVRHGVDVAHFRQALDTKLAEPADLRACNGPILGFFGLIHHWIDCDLLADVARLRPGYSFVLIGADHRRHAGLAALKNVHLLGRRPYAELPAYCKAFDAALLPFARTRMTRNVNPIKLREYLAAGLPVVSTPLPEAERYQPDVMIAADPAAFARSCDTAVRLSSLSQRIARTRTVADETWDAVVERLSRAVMAAAQLVMTNY